MLFRSHELSLAQGILDLVRRHVPDGQEGLVRAVTVRVGRLSGVVTESLDFCFGAIVAGRLSYVSKFSAPRPSVRSVAGGGGETRLYMTWQGGGRKEADLQLFRKAGVEVGQGVIFQFYPKPAEDTLARLEFEYKKRRAEEIRRTYFEVTPKDGGYVFQVIRQTYLK